MLLLSVVTFRIYNPLRMSIMSFTYQIINFFPQSNYKQLKKINQEPQSLSLNLLKKVSYSSKTA